LGDLTPLAGRRDLIPACEVLACHPLTRELQQRSAVVDDGHLGELCDADDHLDDTRVRVTGD
jgi:hypothetical protein